MLEPNFGWKKTGNQPYRKISVGINRDFRQPALSEKKGWHKLTCRTAGCQCHTYGTPSATIPL
jgi:hypothetical protein